MLGERIEAGQSFSAMWNGTAWKLIGDQQGDGTAFATKTADETINNTGTLQNDNHLFFPIGANETWIFNVDFNGVSGTTPDFKFAMTAPAGATCQYNFYLPTGIVNSRVTTCGTATASIPGNGAEQSYIGYGTITNGGTAGTVTLQWAQFTANASNTIGRQGSIIKAYRVRGADFAEIYYADDHTIAEWDIVSLTGDGVSQVKKSTTPYDSKAIGIISTKPGMVLGETDGAGKPVIVGLSGRVPVKVTLKNGAINPGDYITASSIPWVGMKATQPGRVVGKALTGLSWVEQGTVIVFIQNTYYDGVDDAEYTAYAQNYSGVTIDNTDPLDRFTFMVQKSLSKLSPSFASGMSFTASGLSIDGFGSAVNTIASALLSVSGSVNSLASDVEKLQSEIATLLSQQSVSQNTAPVTQETTQVTTTVVTQPPVLTDTEKAIIAAFDRTTDALFVKAETTFESFVSFTRSVVFRANVTFAGRVIFEDEDMAGTAIIEAGASSVEVNFSRPYEVTPKITTSSNSFVSYRITGKSTYGFTIVLSEPSSSDISFDWIAIMVRWARSSRSEAGHQVATTPPVVEVDHPQTVSGETPLVIDSPSLSDTESVPQEETGTQNTPSSTTTEIDTPSIPTTPEDTENIQSDEPLIETTTPVVPTPETSIESTTITPPESTTLVPPPITVVENTPADTVQ